MSKTGKGDGAGPGQTPPTTPPPGAGGPKGPNTQEGPASDK